MKAELIRMSYSNKQTIGRLIVLDGDKQLFNCETLELDWQNNDKQQSCIPKGKYKVVSRTSPKYGKHFHITNVPNRDLILIHHGNYNTDILGCVLVGSSFTDINKDGYVDVVNSKATMNKLVKLLPNEFELTIL